jgi:hypothetical protein
MQWHHVAMNLHTFQSGAWSDLICFGCLAMAFIVDSLRLFPGKKFVDFEPVRRETIDKLISKFTRSLCVRDKCLHLS